MLIPTPFHPRTAPLCESQEWRSWAGYLAAANYESSHEREYYAIRNALALIDVSPLFKYEISGPDATRLVNRMITRDIERCAVGQVVYTTWCDDDGKVIDDGTVARLEPNRYRITAAEPNLAWFQDCGWSFAAQVKEVTQDLASLAVQGPNSRPVLQRLIQGVDWSELRYYRIARGTLGDLPLEISRTGYTGDLGYELWLDPENALRIWDLVFERGQDYGLAPAGMVALDLARIEAGLLLLQVDYISSRSALIPAQKSSPFELGLGWTVDLNKAAFVGRSALAAEKHSGSAWKLVGLEIDWPALQQEFGRVDLVPQVAGRASRLAVPVYRETRQIGQATSQAFSPILKKYIALASLESRFSRLGEQVEVEVTVEYVRRRVPATVVKLPFFNPPRKKA